VSSLIAAADPASVSTVTTVDDGWYRAVTDFAQHTAWLHAVMSALTTLLIAALALLVLAAGWRAWRRADRAALTAFAWACLGTAISIGCGLLLKQVFQESRPCLAMPQVVTVQACPGPTDYSFPSDHTTVAVALAAGLWLIDRRLGALAAAVAVFEGFSRIYLGQHYPHDVVAAILLSTVIVLGGWPLVRSPLSRLVQAGVRASSSTSGETR
jgi:membrane-associated phospholipid phosphatase